MEKFTACNQHADQMLLTAFQNWEDQDKKRNGYACQQLSLEHTGVS